jgi:hypothetical protein
MGPIDLHLERLRTRIGDFQVQEVAAAGWVIKIADTPLPAGWNKQSTHIFIVAPQGYPFAKPDCFWADPDLRLANGNLPQNSQMNNPIPGVPDSLLWFSWHVEIHGIQIVTT